MTTRALVTGGTRGIGAATALLLTEAGYEVWVTGRGSTDPPAGTRRLEADFQDEKQVTRLVDLVRTMDFSVLVNNAGINRVAPLESYPMDDLARLWSVNFQAAFRLCQAVLPAMRRERFGRIVNISSIFGLVSRSGRSAYSATKSALEGMSRALALEVAADNVLVNCVAPGFVETDLTHEVLGDPGMREVARTIPMGRLARPAEIGHVVRFLVGRENTYLTGQTIVVDAGFTSQ